MAWRVAYLMFLLFITAASTNDQQWSGCLSTQFLALGEPGVLVCQFPKSVKSIFWYDNATFDDAQPVVTFKDKQKGGIGYMSGEYDINRNGSLVILRVTLQNEKMYKVISFDVDDLYSIFRISVVVTVTSPQLKPFIENCHSKENCAIQTYPGGIVKCSFAGARPPVQLEWYARKNGREDRVTSSSYSATQAVNLTYETVSEITLPNGVNENLLWLICKSKQAGNDRWSSSEVLVELQRNSFETKLHENDNVFFEVKKLAKLDCPTLAPVDVLVWKKCLKHQCFFIAFKMEKQITIVEGFEDNFRLDRKGSLIISSVELFHEGNYTCVTNELHSGNLSTLISLVVLVPPSPSYLVVAECSSGFDCAISSTGEGTLTCAISRVRPAVRLQWRTGQPEQVITSTIQETSKEEFGLFDISVTMAYKVVNPNDCDQTFIFDCLAYGPTTAIFYSRREVLIKQEKCTLITSDKHIHPAVLGVLIFLFVACIICALVAFAVWKVRSKRNSRLKKKKEETEEENVPLQRESQQVKPDPVDENMKKLIIQQLKLHYEKTYGENCDGSFNRSNYVPNDFSYLNPDKSWNDKNLWESLDSYKDIFNHQKMKDRNVIVEGDVGYGKSTFATFLAMKWYEGEESLFTACEILLFISLGHMGKKNLFEFILRTLLYEETKLDPFIVEEVIRKTPNVWILLDDFDGYVHKNFEQSPISQLLEEKCDNLKIIILARPYCPLIAKGFPVVRLEPFTYLQIDEFTKAKFANKEKLILPFFNEIKAKKDIENLCYIPLYLNIISSSYLCNESIPSEVQTLTTFYEFVFQWLVSRKRSSKNRTENAKGDKTFKHNTTISKVAVNGMKTSTSLWDKSTLQQKGVSGELDLLLEADILLSAVKTEMVSQDFSEMKEVQYVAFAHQTYQCYYGAHFLAFDETETAVKGYLSSMDVKNCKYLFIFTCGLCKGETFFTLIIEDLLQKTDYYPYPVNDCLAQCFYERKFVQTKMYRQLLEKMASSEHRLHFREGDDPNLLTAKAFVVDACAKLKIQVGILSFTNMVTKITDGYCVLKHDVKFTIPDDVHTFYIIDFEKKLSVSDIMKLLRNMSSVEEIIVYSQNFPRLSDEVEIPKGKETVKVIWMSFDGNEVSTLSYPSINFKIWLNCHSTRTMKLLRKQRQWEEKPPDERKKKEMEILTKLDEMGFDNFIKTQSEFSLEDIERLQKRHESDLSSLREFLKGFHMMYEAKTKKEYDKYSENLRQHVKNLTSSGERNVPGTVQEDYNTSEKTANIYGRLEGFVSGLKNYYQSLHI